MPTVQLRSEDYPADEGWRLLDWCLRRGADEFSLAFPGPPYLPRTAWAAVDQLLAPFRRRVASAGDRWALNGETMAVLRAVLPGGPFATAPGASPPDGLTVYRGGEALLRIVRREGMGVLRLRHDEAPSLERAGLPFRPNAR
ncbi:MAG: hypothetical protein KGL38_05785 [Gemmatimonadota bacterium]|nr:hypothetical protein [Gemmatimonadota bacterium]